MTPDARRDVLVESLKLTGLSPEKFAQQILGRDRSTIYRWLAGKTKVPTSVATFLTTHWDKGCGYD